MLSCLMQAWVAKINITGYDYIVLNIIWSVDTMFIYVIVK